VEHKRAYINGFREAGFPTFNITASDEKGILSPSVDKPEYMSLNFIEPLTPGLARYLGLDFYSRSDLRMAIDRAVHSGEVAAASAEPLGKDAFLLFKAVYKGFFAPETARERQTQVDGVYALLIDAPTFVEDIVDGHDLLGLRLSTWNGINPTTLYEQATPPPTDFIGRLFPSQRADTRISLTPTRFHVTIERLLDGTDVHPFGSLDSWV